MPDVAREADVSLDSVYRWTRDAGFRPDARRRRTSRTVNWRRWLPQTDDLLGDEEANRLIDAAAESARDTAWMTLQRDLSLRSGQVQALNVSDYDRSSGRLTTKASWGSGTEERDASTVREVLDRWLTDREVNHAYRNARDDPALFITRVGRIQTRTMRNLVKEYAEVASLSPETHADMLRRPIPVDHPHYRERIAMPVVVPAAAAVRRLKPFKPKADEEYLVTIEGGSKVRSREHETLVNDFADWLAAAGLEPQRSEVIDLAVPPTIIEAKFVGDTGDWRTSIRQAVSQLYEYRHFEVAEPKAPLVFLASEAVPDKWVRYLEQDRRIAVAWRINGGFEVTGMAALALGLD